MAENEYARLVTKTASGVPTIPPSASHNNGDWIDTDVYEGELYIDSDTGKIYTRVGASIIDTGLIGSVNIYNADGALTENREFNLAGFILSIINGPLQMGDGSGLGAAYINVINSASGEGVYIQINGDGTAYRARMSDDNTFGLDIKAKSNVIFDSDISTDPTAIPTSILTVHSTRKGTLPFPRMTKTERDSITSPANALMISDTDTGYPEINHSVYGWQSIGYGEIRLTVDFSVTPLNSGNSYKKSIPSLMPIGKVIHKIVVLGDSIDDSTASTLTFGFDSDADYRGFAISDINNSSGAVYSGNSDRTTSSGENFNIEGNDSVTSGIMEIIIFHT